MKKDSKKLLFIAVVTFISFLIVFAVAFYLLGIYRKIGVFASVFIFPFYYFALTVIALIMMHGTIITKRPYIVMSILSFGSIILMWVMYFCITFDRNVGSVLWLPIVLTVLSLIMSICYISLIIDIVKVDKEIKRNTENNTN